MGIPSYFSYILKKFPNVIKEQKYLNEIHNFFLDSNSIIYDIVNHLTNYKVSNINDIIINKVIEKINHYIDIINPQGITMIAFDGVAPVAKLNQQRERRFKSAYTKQLSQQLQLSNDTWDTTNITPGTSFMSELNKKLHAHYDNNKNIVLTTSDEKGEGEHKIFEYIRTHPYTWDKTNIIYGLDADLIMLALNHLHINTSIYLLRESPHFVNQFTEELKPNELYLFDIQDFADKIVLELESETKYKKRIIKDYIFLCFFLGNDFLPHFPSLNIRTTGIYTLLNHYKEIILSQGLFLTNEDIEWKNVYLFFTQLQIKEKDLIIEELNKRDMLEWKMKTKFKGNDNHTTFKKFENIPILDRNTEKEIDPQKKNFQEKYYNNLFSMKFTTKEKISLNYLEGLEWTFYYYQSGCKNWRWKYEYSYPPLIEDLVNYIPTEQQFFVQDNQESISTIVQLCYVIPKTSLTLLPPKVYKKINKNIYTQDCVFKWAFCKYFWECHVLLPEINIDELTKTLE